MKRIWFDTEFLDNEPDGCPELLAIGAVDNYGKTFYAVNLDCDITKANDWVQKNVIPHLDGPYHTKKRIAHDFAYWVGPGTVEFWGYYCAWDWFLMCRLYGGFMNLPATWPRYCNDAMTIGDIRGKHYLLPEQKTVQHNALNDALWTKQVWEYMMIKGD